jgi:SAM-dependent methyltransferase
MAENRDELAGYYDGVAEKAVFNERMNLIEKLKHRPEKLLTEANIACLAPADASNIELPDASVDYHISTTVLEHIPGHDIERILKEAKRILKEDGVAIHFIDLSDHFQHQDKSITTINFLKYSEEEWANIAGNQFAYCNRMRASDYLVLFEGLGFDVCRHETQEDEEALEIMRNGFMVDERFRGYSVDDLCVTGLRVALKENRKAAGI